MKCKTSDLEKIKKKRNENEENYYFLLSLDFHSYSSDVYFINSTFFYILCCTFESSKLSSTIMYNREKNIYRKVVHERSSFN